MHHINSTEIPDQAHKRHTLSRRKFLYHAAAGILAAVSLPVSVHSASATATTGGKTLILYFSHSGNTRNVAEQIHNRIGGEIIELQPAVPYPRDYNTVVDQAKEEQRRNARPQISTPIPNLETYDTIFIGYPNWWGTMPMLFFTLLEKHDMGTKTVIPFCTHEGSRLGRSEQDLKKLCPRARLLKGFEVRGSRSAGAQSAVDAWLRKIGLIAG